MALQDKIHQLYLLDKQVRGLQRRLDAATTRLRAQQIKLQQLQQQQTELADQLKHAKAHAATAEHQARDIQARIDKHREEMNRVRNNKEYSALLLEVNTLKDDKSKVEDEALEHLSRVERLESESAQAEAKVADQQLMVTQAQSEVDACLAEVGEQLDKLKAQRHAAAAEVPNTARLLFERQARVHEGDAMAEVIEESRRHLEYTCGGCYMSIPVERLNELMTRNETLTCCPNCGRILYVTEDLKQSLAK